MDLNKLSWGKGIRSLSSFSLATSQVVETSVTVNNNSPIQDYVHLDDQTQPTFEMTPGFKPFTLVPMMSIVQQSETIISLNIKDKVWQTVFVCEIDQACMQMSAISFAAWEKAQKGNFSACNKLEIGDVWTQATLKCGHGG